MILLFDFDSTLFPFESLEDLISQSIEGEENQKKTQSQMSQISDLAMNGELDFKTSLEQRIALANLKSSDFFAYYQTRKDAIDGRIINAINSVKKRHLVYIISGGFIEYLEFFALEVFGLKKTEVFANQFKLNSNQQVIGFNQDLPLVKNDGKVAVAQLIKNRHPNEKIIMIGDGYTDWLVFKNGLADAFIGAGFYQTRKKVQQQSMQYSQKFAHSIDQLCHHLNQIESVSECS